MELVDDAVVKSPGAVEDADPRIDELCGQLTSARADVISLMSKLYDLQEVREKANLEHEKLLTKVQAEGKKSEKYIGAEQGGAFSCYHGVLRSIQGIVKAADESIAGHVDVLTQLRLLFEERRNVKAVISTAGLSQERL